MEETNFSRKTIAADDVLEESDSEVLSSEDLGNKHRSDSIEKTTPTVVPEGLEAGVVNTYTTKTYMDKLKLFDFSRGTENLWENIKRPVTMFRFPGVCWAGFFYGTNLVWFNVLNGTASLIFTSVYNFSPAMVGLTYLAPIIGSILATAFTGVYGDRFKLTMARRNGGIYEPEQRLWLTVPFAILIPASLILWGVGAAHGIHWIGPVFGMGILGGCVAIGCSVPITYFIESYREMSGPGMVPIILIRNCLSFAISYGITPWVSNLGIRNCFLSVAFIAMTTTCSFFVMIMIGKKLRDKTKTPYWRYVKQAVDKGMTH